MKLMKKDIKANHLITTFFALESMQLRKKSDQRQFPDEQWSYFDKFLNTGIYQRKFSKNALKEIREEAA
jgi:hypothetical protein